MSGRRVMIMAGGTGGHVFPALALAEVLRQRSCEVVWLGTRQGIEARLVPAAGIPVEWIAVGGLRGKGLVTLLRAPFSLLRALWQSIAAVRRQRPAVVVGLGGYVTGPGGLAAWLLRRPLVIHEQNAVAGLTNRVLARLARPDAARDIAAHLLAHAARGEERGPVALQTQTATPPIRLASPSA